MTAMATVPVRTPKACTSGTHRSVPPEQTLQRIMGVLPRFGITRVADITGLDRIGIPVLAAYRPVARSLAVSMGKGATTAAAAASAVMESIELWHAERPDLPLQWGSAGALAELQRVIDWSGLPRMPGTWFESTTPTAWVESVCLSDGETVLVPFECVHTDGRLPEPAGSGWFVSTSNGLASGNTVAEAQIHSLCEVIERDAVTLWRLGGDVEATTIDADSVTDPVCLDLLGRLRAADLAVLLHDATSDIGITTIHCTLFEQNPEGPLAVYTTCGMGCHLSPAIAVARALTEAAQSRLTLISGARDDVGRSCYRPLPNHDRHLASLRRASTAARRAFGDLCDLSTQTLEQDLDIIIAALLRLGFEPCWVDLTKPGIGIPVGRAMVPGLELLNDVETYRPGDRARALAGSAGR